MIRVQQLWRPGPLLFRKCHAVLAISRAFATKTVFNIDDLDGSPITDSTGNGGTLQQLDPRTIYGEGAVILNKAYDLTDDKTRVKAQKKRGGAGISALSAASTSSGAMIQYIKSKMDEYPNSVVLTQVGSFYEIYLHQAVEFGPKLNLKIARKSQVSPFPEFPFINMAGFPCYQLDRYLKVLVNDLGQTVVLLDQNPDLNSTMSETEKRPVSRIITPGTLVGDSFMDSNKHNYLAAIEFTNYHLDSSVAHEDSPVGISWLDLSVGDFYYQRTKLGDLMSDLSRIKPNEILLDSAIRKYRLETGEWFSDLAELEKYFYSYRQYPQKDTFQDYAYMFDDTKTILSYIADNVQDKELSAMTAILDYVDENLPDANLKLQIPVERFSKDFMQINSRSQEALELFQTHSGSTKGSLFNVIRRTVTPSGTRLLTNWLSYPLVNISSINERLDYAEYFRAHPQFTDCLLDHLAGMDDCERTLQRLNFKRIDPFDLYTVANCIETMSQISDELKLHNAPILANWADILDKNLKKLGSLASKILSSLDMTAIIAKRRNEEELLATLGETSSSNGSKVKKSQKDGTEVRALLKPNASSTLQDLYDTHDEFGIKKKELRDTFRELCENLPVKVNLRWSPMLLYHVHVKLDSKGGDTIEPYLKDINIEGAVLNQTKKTLCIQNKEWTSLGLVKDKFQEHVQLEEERILRNMRSKILSNASRIRACCYIIDQLDVLTSFAELSREMNLTRPELNDSTSMDIQAGRHITVASSLLTEGVKFTANDCHLNCEGHGNVSIITGPNMGGKSTYLRQIALISILAQIGCFVPARSASIGIVDSIFCRVGSGDDLYRGRSTFMVEMLETASILKNATERSLAILDEVGRGTSSADGLALAYASINELREVNKCRTLFSTHFGRELYELISQNGHTDRYSYYHSDLEFTEAQNRLRFNHRLRPGVCGDSHGLEIAELAGFPPSVLNTAREVVSKKHLNPVNMTEEDIKTLHRDSSGGGHRQTDRTSSNIRLSLTAV